MPIKSRKNLYHGVNAHLHSILQNTFAGWEEFHGIHTSDIAKSIDAILPPRYIASYQRSFQLRAGATEEIILKKRAEPDAAIYERDRSQSGRAARAEATAPTMTLPTVEAFDDPEDYLHAIAIRVVDNHELGDPVAWIELLSPTNKPHSAGYDEYNEKRLAALLGGIVLVEIDYLHETPSVIRRLNAYPDDRTFAYSIAVTDPRPVYREGQVDIYGFSVDEPIPKIRIPLLDDDYIVVDMDAIYQQSFEGMRIFSDLVDYAQPPPRLETYSSDDQKHIQARMREASATG